jgi:hypothetical protein
LCAHGGVKDGRSHCGREAIYSHLKKCIQRTVLEDFLERNRVGEVPMEMDNFG